LRDAVHHIAVVQRDRDDAPAGAPPPVQPHETPPLVPLPHPYFTPLHRTEATHEVFLRARYDHGAAAVAEIDHRGLVVDHVGAEVEPGAVGGIANAHAALNHVRG